MASKKGYFPPDFLWGASTSSHQVEGNNYNQWTVWEVDNAQRLAGLAKDRYGQLPNWKQIYKAAQEPENYISGQAIDHFHRYKEDFDIAKSLNLNSLRFGLEWSRLEPEEGQWELEAFEHYRQYINELKKRGLEPIMNIWHWTMPVWFADKGGFAKRGNVKYFKRFVQKLTEELDFKEFKYVITINEPNVYITNSYGIGEWPPQHKNWLRALWVLRNLTIAHIQAYDVLKRAAPHLQVGIASQLANIQAKHPHDVGDELSTESMRFFWNWWFLNRVKRKQDFVGFNYYFSDYYHEFRRASPKVPVSDLGWYMEPSGLYLIMLRVWDRYKKPIIVTENGVADANDEFRGWWLSETMLALAKAASEGVQIKGYLHWSLLDNFEWSSGWWPKFGLVEVDRARGNKRKVRQSAKNWAKWIAEQNK